MSAKSNDFKVYEEKTTKGVDIWRIRSGGKTGDLITSCNTKEQAISIAAQLNVDPWFLDRGNTRADRIARYNKNS